MGSELIVRRWCDRCRAPEGEEGHDFQAEVRLTIGPGVDRVLDLCQVCFDGVLGPVIDDLGELGEAPKRKSPRKAEPAPEPVQPPLLPNGQAPRTSPDPGERQQCEFCPAQPASLGGLKQHLRTRHGLLWTAYQAGEKPSRGVAA